MPSTLLTRLLPFLHWRHRVTRENLRHDALAGLTGAVVVVPQGIAFATIAGMPPEYGLYAGIVPAIIAALFGSSWHLVSGPTTAASIVLFSVLSELAEPGTMDYVRVALTLTFLVGLTQLIMGLARLGTLVNFISHSVIVGFTAGAALLIAANQLKHFLGLDVPQGTDFIHTLQYVLVHLEDIDPWVTLVGLVTVGTGLFFRRAMPRIPYMLVAMVAGSLTAALVNGIAASAPVTTVGAIPSQLPPVSHPDFSWAVIQQLIVPSFAVTLFALTEAMSIARSLAMRSGQHLDSNQEFIGQGLSNVVGSFFSAYIATGSFNRSGVNFEAGARTPLAAVFAGVLLAVVIVFVAPLVAYLPTATMAAILFIVAYGLIDQHQIRTILRASRGETAVLGVTFAATLLVELEAAILIGVILSLVLYLLRTSHPRILSRVPDPTSPQRTFTTDASLPECPQLKIVRIDGSLFFGAINHVRERLEEFNRRQPDQRHLLIIAVGINFIDIAGAEFLADEAKRRRRNGGGLYLYRVKEGLNEPLVRGGFSEEIGSENIFSSKAVALHKIFARLDPDICAQCSKRIFRECATRPSPDQPRPVTNLDTVWSDIAQGSQASSQDLVAKNIPSESAPERDVVVTERTRQGDTLELHLRIRLPDDDEASSNPTRDS